MNLTCPLFLWGFMGSGKSFYGRRIAREWQLPFYETDLAVEATTGMSIPEIFAKEGEKAFRSYEQHALLAVDSSQPAIIATGGGTPCFYDNAAWMKNHGLTLYLHLPVEALVTRLLHSHAKRPLLPENNEKELRIHVEQLLQLREKIYRQAHLCVDATRLTPDYLENVLRLLPF